jgi:bacterioferritin
MQGQPDVIQILNDVLCAELTAINQYFIHARMLENQKYTKLAKHAQEESIGEMKHAQAVIDRILYLDGVPNMQKYMRINVGQTVTEQHEFDLAVEKDAVDRLNKGVELCRTLGDNGTRLLLEQILSDEEGHIDWLEAQLLQIQQMGLPNYLAQQIE